MYELNGKLRPRRQTSSFGVLSNVAKIALMKLQSWEPPVKLAFALTLLVLLGLLAGCGTTSAPSSDTPRNPSPPPLSQSQPSVPYLKAAQENISAWRKSLTDMLAMP
jgi:hypothetical protein